MCKYCCDVGKDLYKEDRTGKEICSKRFRINSNLDGKGRLEWLTGVDVNENGELDVYVLDGKGSFCVDLAKKRINYCPMCGRKLPEIGEKT